MQKPLMLNIILLSFATISSIRSGPETKKDRAARIDMLRKKAIAQDIFDEHNKQNQLQISPENLSIDKKKEISLVLGLFNASELLMAEQIDARLTLGAIEFRRALHGWELNVYHYLIKRESKW